ncbi:glycosyl hydrolase family 61-domain-containing protein [Gymnopilus junonius]|uniref:lytic cellulose monooxygenase (C4-dehydrogenating) n=1 Tax=Gymnopilus junonius TaxID=109634 RepID=A0A9P5NLX4_GYMJU|nr:glycosyl hydrolase family 61-domain-containing protein [Gymnopilus junonius]
MKITSLFVPVLVAASVSAHGFVYKFTVNGKEFIGNVPSAKPAPSVIREVTEQDPVKGASNPSLTCGQNSTAGSLIANVNPGDTVTFDWRTASLGPWPHNTGPMLTYMANCGATTCDKFDISQAKWFKVQQVGRKNDTTWFQADLMTGGVATTTIPNTLAAGNYLIRHEIIALHLATALGGAEFYPSCTQLQVGGNQTGAPQASELVSLPGAYSDNDPGIFDPDVFNPGSNYTFPGPAIASFVSGSGDGTITNGTGSTTGSTPTTASPPAATSAASSKSSKTCKIKKRSTSEDNTLLVRPRHVSRIMRRLAFSHSLSRR